MENINTPTLDDSNLEQNQIDEAIIVDEKKKINFFLLVVFSILLIIVGGIGYFLNIKHKEKNSDQPIDCTNEAKECPDGSFVVRTGPNCEFEECPVQNKDDNQVSDQFSIHKSSDFSFEYPSSWEISEYKAYADSNPVTWNEMTFFDTPDRERVAFFKFTNVEEKNIEDLYKDYEKGGLGEPATHFLSTQKGLIEGNDLLMKTMSDDTPPNGPAYSNSHQDQTFVLATFWCDGNYYRFLYFALNQGSNISQFENLLKSFKCSNTIGETKIPEIDKSFFIYPPVVKYID